jgi:DNA invertase Pin-like site-specific DNA recombinase
MAAKKAKAVGLVRVSTRKQADADHFGPQAQENWIGKLVAQYNLDLVEVISYNDVSGANVMYAPEMQRLLRLIKQPEVVAVVAAEFSRLVRPTEFEDYMLLSKFQSAGVTVYLPSGPLDLKSAGGKFMATIQGAVSAYELATIKGRLMGGKNAARREGLCAGGGATLPTGVLWEKATKRWSYDERYAPKIREAFYMVHGGELSLTRIIDKLQLRLRKNCTEQTKLASDSSLRRLLLNRLFIGEMVWDKKFNLDTPKEELRYINKHGKTAWRQRPLVPREPDEIIYAKVLEPLVPVEVFESVGAKLRSKTDKWRQVHAMNYVGRNAPLFSGGMLVCSCGRPFYTRYSHGVLYYACRSQVSSRARVGDKCDAPAMRGDKLEENLTAFFAQRFPSEKFLRDVLTNYDASCADDKQVHRRVSLLAAIRRLEAKRERVLEQRLDDAITRDDCARRLAAIDDEVRAERKLLDQIPESPQITLEVLAKLVEPLYSFACLDRTQKRSLLMSLFQQITVADYEPVSLYLLPDSGVSPSSLQDDSSQPPVIAPISDGRNTEQRL